MLDIKRIREDYEGVKERVEFRGKGSFGIENVKKYDEERRDLLADVEQKRSRQNAVSREIPKLKKEGKDTTDIMAEMKELSAEIKEESAKLSDVEQKLHEALLAFGLAVELQFKEHYYN